MKLIPRTPALAFWAFWAMLTNLGPRAAPTPKPQGLAAQRGGGVHRHPLRPHLEAPRVAQGPRVRRRGWGQELLEGLRGRDPQPLRRGIRGGG